jgi:hypothetical protein
VLPPMRCLEAAADSASDDCERDASRCGPLTKRQNDVKPYLVLDFIKKILFGRVACPLGSLECDVAWEVATRSVTTWYR